MTRYTKRSITVEAVQFDGTLTDELRAWLAPHGYNYQSQSAQNSDPGTVRFCTLEGTMVARAGDWIIKGVKGECYPCKPDIFAASYVPEGQLEEPSWAEIEAAHDDVRRAERQRCLDRVEAVRPPTRNAIIWGSEWDVVDAVRESILEES